MAIKALFERLKSEFGLIPVAFYNHIKQNGDYAILTGFDRKNPNVKIARIKVLFVRNTLEREVYAYLDEIQAFEDAIFKMERDLRAIILEDMQIQSISEGQFAYVFDLGFEVRRNDYL